MQEGAKTAGGFENPWQGEVSLVINDVPHRLRLTLGALARLETHLGEENLLDLVRRFEERRFSARDILALLTAGLEGGGYDYATEDLARADIAGGPLAAARAGATLLARSFALPETVTSGLVE
ncbi:hypothetical protein RSK20926_20585 [Roseobacter sp. SK209-2-6]|uniref:gene transfer agent family protein n=1 Tax=Roseobacter sp. SK209-2-6 TaxID=388739 RepID=UPI0000F3E75C|nr:gene transfer agent family protein [Roseobacter sp. SK209-2-6]EBA16161.1 hypothetical protein RSK20926_20585 [Roseobacter sp. SK209-2-6]